ncbi:MAG: GNAT family N-acetyltransferase [Solirubrobacteraceae bacterium]
MMLPADLAVRAPAQDDVPAIAALVAACDETYRAWAPAGWTPPPPGRELDRWRGRITDGSWWTHVAVEPVGRVVGLVCFTQAVVQRALPEPPGKPPVRAVRSEGVTALEPIPYRAHVSAVFTHPDRWREGIAAGLLDAAEAAMRAQGYREMQLWTPRDAPARRFYEVAGWRHDGREQWLAELALPIVAYVKAL